MFDLTGKIALVTGGAKGIGKGIAQGMSMAGATLIVADLDKEAGEKTAAEFKGEFLPFDASDPKSGEAAVKKIIDKHGRLDILCSNVGVYPQATIEEIDEDKLEFIFNLNVKSLFRLAKAAIGPMKKQKWGRIVITSSITGPITGYPGWSHYGATKAAQLGFMRTAALELAKFGVTVNAIQPGNILTEGLIAQGEEYTRQMAEAIPTKTLGEPIDIGAAAVFLASEEAKFVTGHSIVVDGGQILPESFDCLN